MDQNSLITRTALGRMASIGDLYDARSDSFCGTSIFKRSIPEGALKTMDADFSELKMMNGDSYSEKFSKLEVEEELATSVLSGLVPLEGVGRFLANGKGSDTMIGGSLLYKVKTKDENLNVYHDDLKDAFEVNAIRNGLGTHVVTGISWGASLILSCFSDNWGIQDGKEVEEDISAKMKKMCLSITSKAAASSEISEGGGEKYDHFDFEIFGDILQTNADTPLPTNLNEAIRFVQQLPSMVSACNDGKGKPLTYRLLPISLLQQYFNFPVHISLRTLGNPTSFRVVQLFDQVSDSQQKLSAFHKDVTNHKYCVMEDDVTKVSNLKNELDMAGTSLRSKLASLITHVRSGRKEIYEVEDLIRKFQASQMSRQNITALLSTWKSIRDKISFAKNLVQGGAKYIGVDSSLDEEVLKDFQLRSFIFFFAQASGSVDPARLNGNYQLFLQEMGKKKGKNCRFYAVDCDIHWRLLPKNTSSCVQVVCGGEVITEDLLQDQEDIELTALVQAIDGTVGFNMKPNKCIPLTIPCTGVKCNAYREHDWTCSKCSSKIEYGFDNHVYCDCGKTPVFLLEFKCSDPEHGEDFERHDEDVLSKLILKLKPLKELNILILGETGVGKSTWINGFINYLRYESLEAAEAGELCTLIPTEFTVYDGNFSKITVSTGSDQNEVLKAGQSATQEAKVYPFNMGKTKVRLIDTPGIGDTRGIEQDRKNFQNILGTLSNLEEIHGICILLKPNNSRLNVMFRFCIKELLTYLHRDASKNIVFCFTNSRGTFYRPGDTMPALISLLEENKDVEIAVNSQTVYCFDSEAYRFLAAVKNNPPVQFSNDERENFSKSWEKSIIETKRMLNHIEGLVHHPIQSTLNLNHARELVLKMVRPLAEISRNIQTNKSIVEDEKNDIEKTKENIKALKQKQMTTRTEIEVRRLDYPKTVCSNSNCVKIWSTDGIKTTEYVTICHGHCYLSGVKEDSVGDPELMGCWAMVPGFGVCRHLNCGHHYREHLHIYYDSIQVVKKVENHAVKESITKNLTAAEMKQKMIEEKNQLIEEYEFELKEIERSSVTFAYFLKSNAITPYNDGMEMYLKHLIREEEDKVALGGNRKTLNYLIQSMESYLMEKSVLEKQMQMGEGSVPKPGEIDFMVKKLKELKHSGQVLKDSLDCANYVGRMVYKEAVVEPPKRKMFESIRNWNWGGRTSTSSWVWW